VFVNTPPRQRPSAGLLTRERSAGDAFRRLESHLPYGCDEVHRVIV